MASLDEIRKKNLEESNDALSEAINLTSRLSDVMKSVVGEQKEKSELDKSSVSLTKEAVKVTRSLSSEYTSIKDVQKDLVKNQQKSSDITKQIGAITKDMSAKEQKSLDVHKKRAQSLKTAEGLAKSLADKQKQGLDISDSEVERANKLVARKAAQLDQSGAELSNSAQQVAFLEEQGEALDQNSEYLKEQLQRQKNINSASGSFGAIMGGAGKVLDKLGLGSTFLGKAFTEVGKKTREFAEKATDGGKKSLGAFGKLKVMAKGFGAAMKTSLGPMAIILSLVGAIQKAYQAGAEAVKRMSSENTGLARTLGTSQKNANALAGEMRGIASEMGITGGAAIQAAGGIYSSLDGAEKLSRSTLATFTKLSVFAGFSADNIADMQKFAKLAGKEGGVIAEEMASTAQQTIKANKLNISMRGLMQAVGKQSAIVKLNSKGSATQMVKQVAQAKALGLEMSKVEAIASGMLDLESSLAAEMEAELLTGKELNLEKAREAALNNNNGKLMEEIKNQFGSIEEFQDMNRVQQEAFGKAVGLSRDGLAEMLVTSKENEATNTDMVSTQDKSLAAMQSMASVAEGLQASEEGRQAAFSKIFALLNPIVELFKDLQPLIMEIIEPIVEFLAPVLKEIMEKILPFIKSIFASLRPIIESLLVAIMPIVDVLMGVMDTVLPIISKLFQMLAPIVIKIVEAITPFIESLSEIALKLLPIITKVFDQLTPVIEKILEAIMPIFDIIADLAKSLLPVISGLFDSLIPVIMTIVDAVLPIVEMFGELLADLLPPIIKVIGGIVKALTPIFNIIGELVKILMPTLISMFKSLKPILDPIMTIFEGVGKVVEGLLTGDFGMVADGLKSIASGILNLVIGLFESLLNLPLKAINAMLDYIPGLGPDTIPMVEFGRVELAEGGIVNSPTNALIGEAGPEAVVPLNDDKSMNVFSKSLEAKLDMLISAVQQGGNVYIDGEKAGTALVMGNYKLQ